MTLLVAGFIIGPSGSSIRGIVNKSGAHISSSTQLLPHTTIKTIREFIVVGDSYAIHHALDIMYAAVERYKQLAEGPSRGTHVERCQTVCGVKFCYQPPPRHKAPYAAGIRVSRMSGQFRPWCSCCSCCCHFPRSFLPNPPHSWKSFTHGDFQNQG